MVTNKSAKQTEVLLFKFPTLGLLNRLIEIITCFDNCLVEACSKQLKRITLSRKKWHFQLCPNHFHSFVASHSNFIYETSDGNPIYNHLSVLPSKLDHQVEQVNASCIKPPLSLEKQTIFHRCIFVQTFWLVIRLLIRLGRHRITLPTVQKAETVVGHFSFFYGLCWKLLFFGY